MLQPNDFGGLFHVKTTVGNHFPFPKDVPKPVNISSVLLRNSINEEKVWGLVTMKYEGGLELYGKQFLYWVITLSPLSLCLQVFSINKTCFQIESLFLFQTTKSSFQKQYLLQEERYRLHGHRGSLSDA